MQAFHLIGAAPFYTNSFLLITEADHAVIIDPASPGVLIRIEVVDPPYIAP